MPEVVASLDLFHPPVSLDGSDLVSRNRELELALQLLLLMRLRVHREENTACSAFPDSVLSVTAGNRLVSKEINAYYLAHMLQQAGYQEVPYLKCFFRDTSQYLFVCLFVLLAIRIKYILEANVLS
jgi:hypothetical protein